jgi:hypothetical protein
MKAKWSEVKMCGRKRRYTAREAHGVAERLNAKQVRYVRPYRCPFGNHFHVGGGSGETRSNIPEGYVAYAS